MCSHFTTGKITIHPLSFPSFSTLLIGAAITCTFAKDVAAAPDTHCSTEEITYFSCRVLGSTKVASVCGSNEASLEYPRRGTDAWLQYRFGTIGKPEFIFPSKKKDSTRKFKIFWSDYDTQPPNGFFIRDLYFENGSASYWIRVSSDGTEEYYGIYIREQAESKQITMLPCADASVTSYVEKEDSNSNRFEFLIRRSFLSAIE